VAVKVKGLSRIDKSGMVGFYARIRRGSDERRKWFSDSEHGGKTKARARAIEWLHSQARDLGLPWTQHVVVTAARGNGPTVGVRRVRRTESGPSGRPVVVRDCFEASIQYERRVRRTSFSCRLHGVAEARRLAIETRRQWELEIFGKAVRRS
jgi:hypothetical protein